MGSDLLIGSQGIATASTFAVVLAASFMPVNFGRSLFVTPAPAHLVIWLIFALC